MVHSRCTYFHYFLNCFSKEGRNQKESHILRSRSYITYIELGAWRSSSGIAFPSRGWHRLIRHSIQCVVASRNQMIQYVHISWLQDWWNIWMTRGVKTSWFRMVHYQPLSERQIENSLSMKRNYTVINPIRSSGSNTLKYPFIGQSKK